MTALELFYESESRFTNLARRAARTLGTWRANAQARAALARVSRRDLADAGISITMVQHELRQPFWRPLQRLRDDPRRR